VSSTVVLTMYELVPITTISLESAAGTRCQSRRLALDALEPVAPVLPCRQLPPERCR